VLFSNFSYNSKWSADYRIIHINYIILIKALITEHIAGHFTKYSSAVCYLLPDFMLLVYAYEESVFLSGAADFFV